MSLTDGLKFRRALISLTVGQISEIKCRNANSADHVKVSSGSRPFSRR